MEMDFGHIWAQMSIAVKAIMMILVFMSVYSLGVSLERWWAFRAAKKQSVKFAIEIGPLLKQEKLKEATKLYEEAAACKPLDAMERLDVEAAKEELA